MKLQINTTEKTIKIEESVNLNDLFETLDKLFPNLEWKEFKLEQTIITNWTSPIVIQPFEPYQSPLYPWQSPIIYGNNTTSETTTSTVTNVGIYNVQV